MALSNNHYITKQTGLKYANAKLFRWKKTTIRIYPSPSSCIHESFVIMRSCELHPLLTVKVLTLTYQFFYYLGKFFTCIHVQVCGKIFNTLLDESGENSYDDPHYVCLKFDK